MIISKNLYYNSYNALKLQKTLFKIYEVLLHRELKKLKISYKLKEIKDGIKVNFTFKRHKIKIVLKSDGLINYTKAMLNGKEIEINKAIRLIQCYYEIIPLNGRFIPSFFYALFRSIVISS